MGYVKSAVALSALFGLVGMMIGGPLSDRMGRKLVITTGLAADALIFIAVAQVDTMMGVILSAMAMGFFGGVIGPVWGAYVGDIFGRHALATIVSLFIFAIGIVGGTGSFLFGWIHDKTGSYTGAWLFSAFCFAATCFLYLLTRKEIKPEEALEQ